MHPANGTRNITAVPARQEDAGAGRSYRHFQTMVNEMIEIFIPGYLPPAVCVVLFFILIAVMAYHDPILCIAIVMFVCVFVLMYVLGSLFGYVSDSVIPQIFNVTYGGPS